MLFKTHLSMCLFVVLLLLPVVNNPFIFAFSALFSTLLPDIDTPFSKFGRHKFYRLVQFFTKHRGIIHSLTFCILVSLIFSIFLPVIAFGFFIGYSFHLLGDSFTKSGIVPFWPYPKKARGKISTGGLIEKGIFLAFLIVNLFLVIFLFF